MLIWLLCSLIGHKTVARVSVGEKFDYINQLTGLPDKGQNYTLVRLAFCARCGKKVHDNAVYPMVPLRESKSSR